MEKNLIRCQFPSNLISGKFMNGKLEILGKTIFLLKLARCINWATNRQVQRALIFYKFVYKTYQIPS